MREGGFVYLEAVIALFLMISAMAAMEPALKLMKQKTAESANNTTAYLLAKSSVEQWKAGNEAFAASTGQEEVNGMMYTIMTHESPVSEMIDRCEVTISWKDGNGTLKTINLFAYRYITKKAAFIQKTVDLRLSRFLYLL